MNGWTQTITLMITVAFAVASCAFWMTSIMSDQRLINASIINRLGPGGWSRPEQQEFVNTLREMANHPVPNLKSVKTMLEHNNE